MLRLLISLCFFLLTAACTPGGGGRGGGGGGGGGGENDDDQGDLIVSYDDAEGETAQIWEEAFQDNELPENLAQVVNATYALPHDVMFLLGECGMINAFWAPSNDAIVMCWELVIHMAEVFANTGVTNEAAVEGAIQGWIWAFFHELGHALIDLFDLPSTGQEEDAVDEFSTLMLIDYGYPVAAINGALYFFLVAGDPTPPALADEHSLGEQRFYNVLCLVYGSDPTQELRDSLVSAFPEMDARLDRCPGEYEDKQDAWSTLLEPHEL